MKISTKVTPDNFRRAETDMYFNTIVKMGGFGKFHHHRTTMPIDKQTVIRTNRDTLYSSAIFDLDAGPVVITLPDAGKRFISMQIFDEDQYTPIVIYKQGDYTFSRKEIGTRYIAVVVRTFIDPENQKDIEEAHTLQDAIKVKQNNIGKFEFRNGIQSQKKVHDTLNALGATLTDTKNMYGTKDKVDPVRHLIGTSMAWGGNPETEALYLNVTPEKNDGKTFYKLKIKDVPVDGFWSISLYNAEGYYEPNKYNAYTLNNITAKKDADGSITIQFGGCNGSIKNCLPIMPGWNYVVRLYRPRKEILDGSWKFPEAGKIE